MTGDTLAKQDQDVHPIMTETSKSMTETEASEVMERLESYLDDKIRNLNRQGTAALVLTFLIGAGLFYDIKVSLLEQLALLETSTKPNQVLAYLIFRSSALGVIATTILYFGARMTVASYDQAMRFTKRKLGTVFLGYLYKQHKTQLENDPVTLIQIMGSFEIWNKTVESAFSNIKTERGDNLLSEKLKELSKDKEKKEKEEKE